MPESWPVPAAMTWPIPEGLESLALVAEGLGCEKWTTTRFALWSRGWHVLTPPAARSSSAPRSSPRELTSRRSWPGSSPTAGNPRRPFPRFPGTACTARGSGTAAEQEPGHRFASCCRLALWPEPSRRARARRAHKLDPAANARFQGTTECSHPTGLSCGASAARGFAADPEQRTAALGAVALPAGTPVGQGHLSRVGDGDLLAADAPSLRGGVRCL